MSFRLYRQSSSTPRFFSPTPAGTTAIDNLFPEEKYSGSSNASSISAASSSISAASSSISAASSSISAASSSISAASSSISAASSSISAASSSISSANASSFRDVHVYDYSYKDLEYTPLVSNPREWIERLIPLMRNPVAIQGLHLILANINTLNNFDTTNQKRAEDLLADIAYSILEKKSELLELLEEQLADMYQLGQCAQGRVTRLWQLRALL